MTTETQALLRRAAAVLEGRERVTNLRRETLAFELRACAEAPETTPIRAHVLGCPKNFSVPVDLCYCGGRDFLPDQPARAEALPPTDKDESRSPDGDGPAVGHIVRQRCTAPEGTQVPGAGSEPADSHTPPATNKKDVGAYIASMADGGCCGDDPEHECDEVFAVEHWCKSCLAAGVLAWHQAEVQRYLKLKAAALAPSTDSAEPHEEKNDEKVTRVDGQ